jgi:ATP-dependent exoDNAse (exonuclease V) alpha subunit
MSVSLGSQQQQALEVIESFLTSKEQTFTLSGYAGTGKSFLISYLVDILEKKKISVVLCAPTHKAKIVMERFTGRKAVTIHKLLALSPKLDILDLDLKDLKFKINKKSQLSFPTNGLVLCDEASMVNDVLFDYLLQKSKECNSKLIFVGDIAQIKPVNDTSLSKVFSCPNTFHLTEIFRQRENSALSEVLFESRTNFIDKFSTDEKENGSIYTINNPKDFILTALPIFKNAVANKDILEVKILSYTNERMSAFNRKIHEILFGDLEFGLNEFLTCYDSVEFDYSEFWNGMDYIIVEEPKKELITIPLIGVFSGYILTVYDSLINSNTSFKILSPSLSNQEKELISYTIESIRLEAINLQFTDKKKSNNLWKDYYKIIGSFTCPFDLVYDNRIIRKKTFDLGYALTLHKSQGSSINHVFIDMPSIAKCRDSQEQRQLQYVSLSRTKNNVYILQQ